MDQIVTRQQDSVHLGTLDFASTAARTITTRDHPAEDGSTR
jgi:hypothetical protein